MKEENILIIGSGFLFHDLHVFDWQGGTTSDSYNDAFQNWLEGLCVSERTQAERQQQLIEWQKAPRARYRHPREEHLMPLHTCVALADGPASKIFDDYILGQRAIAYKW